MRKASLGKKKLAGLLALILSLALALGCVLYVESYYRADLSALSYVPARPINETALEGGYLLFDPGDAQTGFIFYPGGKVERDAYIPLMRRLAERGVLCVLCSMPLRLAVLDLHAADGAREEIAQITHWYVGGHSLGGAAAAMELNKHPGVYDGLILLGAYSTKDLSAQPIRVLSVYGSLDGVMDREKYAVCRKNFPPDAREYVIDGGNHACFGAYGRQKGDGEAAITNEAQLDQCADAVASFLIGA